MSALIAAHDWSGTLGPTANWPQSLKTAVSLLVHSPVPIVLLWGEDGIMLYNDAYSAFAGSRHPKLLGSKVREGWPEVADFNDNVMKVGLAGGTLSYKDQELTLHRSGKPEPVWMNLDYSPVIDESGKPGGVIAIVVETTERVLAERGTVAERARLAQMFRDAPSFMAQLDGPAHVFTFTNNAYQQLIGHRDVIGKPIRAALPEIAGQGFFELLDDIRSSGKYFRGHAVPVKLQRAPGMALENRLVDFIYQPVRDAAGAITGIFVEGYDVTESQRGQSHRAALSELSDAIRDQEDPEKLAYAAAEILGRTLGVSRAGYGTIDKAAETITIERDWNAPGIKSLAGVLHFRDYGSYIEDLKRGETVVCTDAFADPRTAANAPALKAISAQSFVNMPVTEDGDAVALLYLNRETARDWTAEEIALIRETAERTRNAIARRRAERELRANEAQLRFLDTLGREIAKTQDADAIMATTTRLLGEHLHVAICAYADMDADRDGFTIRGDWSAPGARSIVGHYRLIDFGKLAYKNLSTDLPLVLRDVAAELPPEEAAAFQAMGIAATLCIPLVKDGRLTALMAVHDKAPRAWTADDLALLAEVTERSWAHIERVRAAAGLVASEAQFGSMAQAMPNHVWTALPNGMLDWFNDRVYEYSGAAPGSLDGVGWTAMVHPDDLPAAGALWGQALADGATYETQFRLRRADGAWRWHLARAVPVKNAAGAVTRWVGTNTDIHDQKEISQALRELNSELEAKVIAHSLARGRTWQLSPDIIGVLNAEGYFETSNPAWQTVLGWSEREVAATVFFDFIHPDDLPATQAAWVAAIQRGEPALRFENRYRTKQGGYRWLSWVAVPDDGKVYCNARDITAEKEREAQLVQAEEALRQAQKMEAVGQLTGGIAHDFNNLLQGITGALDRVQHRIAEGRVGDVDRFLKAAVESANRAAALTHRLLAFSRRQTLDPRPLDVNRLIGGMEDLVRRTMGPNVSTTVVGAGGLWPIKADGSQLENSLLNLCINARDSMPNGGALTIETANKWLDDRAARERELPPGQYVSLCVTDTGTGMTPDVIARAFDPFFTTKPLGQGTGLGLSMIYGFVRQSGGQVRIYSEPDKGTTMCLYFPRHAGAVEDETAPVSDMVERGFGETVLVVDDEPTVRMLIAEVLTESFYNIVEAGDGPAAMKILESSQRVDLMITDVGLPGGMNGRQVADAARVARKDLKVLFITGYAENAAVGNGHLDAGMEILAKPFAMSTLANKVREMIET